MKPICFVCVAFGDKRYLDQQVRCLASIKEHHPEAATMFWTDELPPGSNKFLDSLYGFKVHAVLNAINEGHERIIFLDPACYLLGRVDFLFDLCPAHGVVAVKDDNKLPASNTSLEHFSYRRSDIADFHLVGGSMYVFHTKYSMPVFRMWYDAERSGVFGSQFEAASEKLQGHRYDETCMALSLYRNGFQPVATDVGSYNFEGAMIRKQHFK